MINSGLGQSIHKLLSGEGVENNRFVGIDTQLI